MTKKGKKRSGKKQEAAIAPRPKTTAEEAPKKDKTSTEKDLSVQDLQAIRDTITRLEQDISVMEDGLRKSREELEAAKLFIRDERKKLRKERKDRKKKETVPRNDDKEGRE